jgi:hypothetical protein
MMGPMWRLRLLGARPTIFEPIEITPETVLSDALGEAIAQFKSLIYVDYADSQYEGWYVPIEVDLARRIGINVYRCDPSGRNITLDDRPPPEMPPLIVTHSRKDDAIVRDTVDWLRSRRAVDTQSRTVGPGDNELDPMGRWNRHIESCISDGGAMVVFWSRSASNSEVVQRDIEIAAAIPDHVFFPILLDDEPLRPPLDRFHALRLSADGRTIEDPWRLEFMLISWHELHRRRRRNSGPDRP